MVHTAGVQASTYNPDLTTRSSPEADASEGSMSLAPVPSLFKVYLDYMKEASGVKNGGFKVVSCLSDWTFTFFPNLTAAKELSTANKQAKNWASLGEIPSKVVDVASSGQSLYEKRDITSFGALVNKMSCLVAPVVDVLRVASDKIQPLSQAAAQTVGTIFNSALVFSTTYSAVEELQKIDALQTKEEQPMNTTLAGRVVAARDAQITESWMKIAVSISYGLLGAIGLATTYMALQVAPIVTLSLATSGLAFILLGQVWKKTQVEPALLNVKMLQPQKV